MAFGGENAESYYDEGLTALVKGDVERAVELFTRAVELDRSLLVAQHQLGKCYVRLGQAKRAIEVLNKVVAKKWDFVPARLDLGYAFLQDGNALDARKQFAEALSLQPKNAKAHMGMGQAFFQDGDWAKALTQAQEAQACGGANFAVLYLLGRAARLTGDTVLADESLKEAEALIEKSVELSPDMPEGYFLRGEVCFAQNKFAAALDHYRAAEDRADPNRHYSAFGETFTRLDVTVKRALCLHRLGNVAGARELGNQITEISPGHKLGQALKNL